MAGRESTCMRAHPRDDRRPPDRVIVQWRPGEHYLVHLSESDYPPTARYTRPQVRLHGLLTSALKYPLAIRD
jgi:hypothetical protein